LDSPVVVRAVIGETTTKKSKRRYAVISCPLMPTAEAGFKPSQSIDSRRTNKKTTVETFHAKRPMARQGKISNVVRWISGSSKASRRN
jgi:hypothetical protein